MQMQYGDSLLASDEKPFKPELFYVDELTEFNEFDGVERTNSNELRSVPYWFSEETRREKLSDSSICCILLDEMIYQDIFLYLSLLYDAKSANVLMNSVCFIYYRRNRHHNFTCN